jgi:hypothetical protein
LVNGTFVEIHGEERLKEEPAAVQRALQGPLRTVVYAAPKTAETEGQELLLGAIRITTITGRRDNWSWEVDLPQKVQRLKATT